MQRKRLGAAIDAGASLLAGGAAAFLLFAMPEELLARAFAGAGLASFSPKFQPPFGAGIRFALVAGAGLIACAFVWSLMKALDRGPSKAGAARAEPVRLPEPEADAPRLRKADAHPDAPARRPLLAGRDLGEPLDLEPAQAIAEPFQEPAEAEEAFVAHADPAPEPDPRPVAAPQPDALPAFLVAQPEEPEAAAEPEPEPEPQPVETGEDSIVSLMARFESGLVRKKQALPDRRPIDPVPAPSAPPSFAPEPAFAAHAPPAPAPASVETGPTPVGHRLRSAIADLQKVAGG